MEKDYSRGLEKILNRANKAIVEYAEVCNYVGQDTVVCGGQEFTVDTKKKQVWQDKKATMEATIEKVAALLGIEIPEKPK